MVAEFAPPQRSQTTRALRSAPCAAIPTTGAATTALPEPAGAWREGGGGCGPGGATGAPPTWPCHMPAGPAAAADRLLGGGDRSVRGCGAAGAWGASPLDNDRPHSAQKRLVVAFGVLQAGHTTPRTGTAGPKNTSGAGGRERETTSLPAEASVSGDGGASRLAPNATPRGGVGATTWLELGPSRFPQSPQNRRWSGLSAPHRPQRFTT